MSSKEAGASITGYANCRDIHRVDQVIIIEGVGNGIWDLGIKVN